MKIIPIAVALLLGRLLAAPAFAQSRVYTNADIGKKLERIDTIRPELLEGLKARQFVFVPDRAPESYVIPYDGTRDVMAPLTLQYEPLSSPWGLTTYFPYVPYGFGFWDGVSGMLRQSDGAAGAASLYRPAPPPPAQQNVMGALSAGVGARKREP
jgi:hypothetical protein